jgi:hypothetical protein
MKIDHVPGCRRHGGAGKEALPACWEGWGYQINCAQAIKGGCGVERGAAYSNVYSGLCYIPADQKAH